MADNDEPWVIEDFNRRHYEAEGDLDGVDFEVMIKRDGRPWMTIKLREPGMLALVSRPDSEAIEIELVGPGGKRYTDIRLPSGENTTLPLPQWVQDALYADKDPACYPERQDEG